MASRTRDPIKQTIVAIVSYRQTHQHDAPGL